MGAANLTAGIPSLFRNYPATENRTINCTIWEAARATSSAPTFFERIAIGDKGMEVDYIDGGLGCNNPTEQVLRETERVFPHRHVACILSIGTGHKETISIKKPRLWDKVLPMSAINAVKDIATDCERTHQAVSIRFKSLSNVYFRFGVENGMQSVMMDQWEKLGIVTAHTDHYLQLQHVEALLKAAVSVLHAPGRNIPTIQLST
jgi:predicted acylesterase/phospholipase RssA